MRIMLGALAIVACSGSLSKEDSAAQLMRELSALIREMPKMENDAMRDRKLNEWMMKFIGMNDSGQSFEERIATMQALIEAAKAENERLENERKDHLVALGLVTRVTTDSV